MAALSVPNHHQVGVQNYKLQLLRGGKKYKVARMQEEEGAVPATAILNLPVVR
jgi:hypothetical protein